jgi:hypothetical protein
MPSARMLANSLAVTAAISAAVLYRFPPQENSFYPRCPFFALTNHYCPGCGATRAMAELLHGHVAAAWHFNAALVLLLPLLLCYFGKMYWTAVRRNQIDWPQIPDWSWRAALACILIFAVARNLSQSIL